MLAFGSRPPLGERALVASACNVTVMHDESTMSSSSRTLASLRGSLGAKLGANDHRRPATLGNSRP